MKRRLPYTWCLLPCGGADWQCRPAPPAAAPTRYPPVCPPQVRLLVLVAFAALCAGAPVPAAETPAERRLEGQERIVNGGPEFLLELPPEEEKKTLDDTSWNGGKSWDPRPQGAENRHFAAERREAGGNYRHDQVGS